MTDDLRKKNRFQSFILIAVLSLIWGSSFILMKKGMTAFSASQVAALRVFIAALFFMPYIIKNFKKIPLNKSKYIIIFALAEIAIPPFLYTIAETVVDSTTAGILNGLTPLFTLIVGILVYKLTFNIYKTAGVVIGFAGAILIIFFKGSGADSFGLFNMANIYGLLIVIATFLYGIAGNVLKEHLQDVNEIMISAVAFVSMGIPLGIFLLFTDFSSISLTSTTTIHALAAIILLSTFGSALAIILINKLIQKSSALFASFVTYFIPFVAMLWGYLDGEGISLLHISSLLIILFGMYLANKGEDYKPEPKFISPGKEIADKSYD